ncbi:hypothetical protein B0I35DRAFT_154883 [Stachybotrys elegans]|uniref:Zn(2)-C6 fungal-type domain-containing protein n=1 Tax=Stachybotrys elegans TaxID=80388 RepID=A0A8K0S9A3_9HYPO|nr:hypothetical protein B0I35DRAFT_154883 [Stachybotrys elegans]
MSRARKVKCDEEKPECQRCTSTGRKCDGYQQSLQWKPLSLPTRLPSRDFYNPTNSRALQFFHVSVAPRICGEFSAYLWTNLILQLGDSQPSIRHSIIAMSLLYEDFVQCGQNQATSLAIRHYNVAIRQLMATKDISVILVTCLLFLCIEMIQGSELQALMHLYAAFRILYTSSSLPQWVHEFLTPVYRRQTLFALKFGLDVNAPEELWNMCTAKEIRTPQDARLVTDTIYGRTFQLVSQGREFRRLPLHIRTPPRQLLHAQQRILDTIQQCRGLIKSTWGRGSQPEDQRLNYLNSIITLEASKVAALLAFESSEMASDKFADSYEMMLPAMEEVSGAMNRQCNSHRERIFMLETGYLIHVFWVILKCRTFGTRMRALALLRRNMSTRAGFWDVKRLLLIARRVIELEHDLMLDHTDQVCNPSPWTDEPPPEDRRIRLLDCNFRAPSTENIVGERKNTLSRMVSFTLRDSEGKVYTVCEHI